MGEGLCPGGRCLNTLQLQAGGGGARPGQPGARVTAPLIQGWAKCGGWECPQVTVTSASCSPLTTDEASGLCIIGKSQIR